MIPILFLHGFLGDPSSFDAVARLLPGYELLRPQLPGHGLCPGDVPADFDGYLAAVADGLPGRVVACGYSMGARLALALAVERPAQVAAGVLVGVNPGLPDGERGPRAVADGEWADLAVRRGMETFVDAWEGQPLFSSQQRLPSTQRLAERKRRMGHRASAVAAALRSCGLARQPDYRDRLKELRVPLTLLAGEEDTKFTGLHASMATACPDRIEARTIPGVGHNLALEAPEAVASVLRERLQSLMKGAS